MLKKGVLPTGILVTFVVIIVSSAILLAEVHGTNSAFEKGPWLSLISFLLMAISVILVFYHLRHDWCSWKNTEEIKKNFLSQELIHAELSRLAVELDKFCKKESRLLGEPDVIEDNEGSLASLKKELLRRKEAFWNAHTLARELRYPVMKSFKEYLPKRDEPAVTASSE